MSECLIDALEGAGWSVQITACGIYVPVRDAGEDDPAAADALEEIREICAEFGAEADWTGNGNAGADGKSTSDVGITLAERWMLYEGGHQYANISADDIDEALEEARSNVDRSNYTCEGTIWIDVEVVDIVTGENGAATVMLEPEEPDCVDGHDHDWQSPYSVLGGIKDNPGVWGHGGGVIIKECCAHCGAYRVTDTWAQRQDTGEQGLTSVEYEDADEDSRWWLFILAADDADEVPLPDGYSRTRDDEAYRIVRDDDDKSMRVYEGELREVADAKSWDSVVDGFRYRA